MPERGTHVHFMGLGGTGMSPLATILHEMGARVSGCDVSRSEVTDRFAGAGVRVSLHHDPSHIDGVDTLVISTAIAHDNAELVAARRRGIRIMHRSELLAELLNARRGVAVTGAHGKTTITSMIAWVLERAGLNPTVAIGGQLPGLGDGAKYGDGPHFVAEADESDRSFLRYRPEIAVVTSVDPDHLEHWNDDPRELVNGYATFLEHVRPGGLAVLSFDDERLRRLAERVREDCRTVSYAMGSAADTTAESIQVNGVGSRFTVRMRGRRAADARLSVPGEHNVANALAALTVCAEVGVPPQAAADHLADFRGAKRRFQVLREVGGVTVIDDYAHHPVEIAATLAAARGAYPGRRLVVLFQPHRYSRTHALMDEFAGAFRAADVALVTDVYAPPPEEPIPEVSGAELARRAKAASGPHVRYIGSLDDARKAVLDELKAGDVFVTMGAGDVWRVARQIVEQVALQG